MSLADLLFKNTHNRHIIKLILHFVLYNVIFIAPQNILHLMLLRAISIILYQLHLTVLVATTIRLLVGPTIRLLVGDYNQWTSTNQTT